MKPAFHDPGWMTRNSGENVVFIADDAPVHLYVVNVMPLDSVTVDLCSG